MVQPHLPCQEFPDDVPGGSRLLDNQHSQGGIGLLYRCSFEIGNETSNSAELLFIKEDTYRSSVGYCHYENVSSLLS